MATLPRAARRHGSRFSSDQASRSRRKGVARRTQIGIVGLEAHGAHWLCCWRIAGSDPASGPIPIRVGRSTSGGRPHWLLAAQSRAGRTLSRRSRADRSIDDGRGSRHGELTRRDIEAIGPRCTMLVACMDLAFPPRTTGSMRSACRRTSVHLFELAGPGRDWPARRSGRTGCFMCLSHAAVGMRAGFRCSDGFGAHLDALKSPRAASTCATARCCHPWRLTCSLEIPPNFVCCQGAPNTQAGSANSMPSAYIGSPMHSSNDPIVRPAGASLNAGTRLSRSGRRL